jgi:hypothetical protein
MEQVPRRLVCRWYAYLTRCWLPSLVTLVADEKTGSHSIYAQWQNLEIMFHVSTMIPHYAADPQQLERKRHLGNDLVLIIFRDAHCMDPFDPTKIKSQFNRMTRDCTWTAY